MESTSQILPSVKNAFDQNRVLFHLECNHYTSFESDNTQSWQDVIAYRTTQRDGPKAEAVIYNALDIIVSATFVAGTFRYITVKFIDLPLSTGREDNPHLQAFRLHTTRSDAGQNLLCRHTF